MNEITPELLEQYQKNYAGKPVQTALRRVLVNSDLSSIFVKQEALPGTKFLFSTEVKTLPVANQKQSGRCWIFAGLNVLRENFAKKHDLKNFELSQNYTAFWDKFEKINYFLESIDDFLDCEADDRTLQYILQTGIQDGGQWDMFTALVDKYGVVPQDFMPETHSSSNTKFMNQIINIKLRQYAATARTLSTQGNKTAIAAVKNQTRDELYTFLQTNFGVPPQTFTYEYQNEAGINILKEMTPQAFFKEEISIDFDNYVSVINSPTKDKPFMETYTVSYLGNVVGAKPVKYLNLEMPDFKKLVIKQLKNDEVVWFGSDVSFAGDRTLGYWDDAAFAFDELLEMKLDISKENALDLRQSAMNHAMLITGVHEVNGVPNRYKIENSWGDTNGNKGYYVCSDTWFDKYVYQAVINKKYLSSEQLKAWDKEPIVLKPWDPMGSLAE